MKHTHNKSARASIFYCATLCSLVALVGCDEPQVILPASLDTPTEMALSQGSVCMDLQTISDEGLLAPTMRRCTVGATPSDQEGLGSAADILRERGSIGLITNASSDRVAVVALGRVAPSLVDLDLATPGVTHVTVGDRPVSIATSRNGDVAVTANQLGKSLSVINVYALAAMEEDIPLPGAPNFVRISRKTNQVVVGIPALDDGSGGALLVRDGVTCEPTDDLPAPPNTFEASKGCLGQDPSLPFTTLPLPGTLHDLEFGPLGEFAYALYSDRPYLSVFAIDEASRGDDACLTGGSAPCEVQRIGLTYGCSDGIDNDGDGLIDQLDGQCFGPNGAESADGIGRVPVGACSDGIDNDGDGLADRLDPDCRDGAQSTEAADELPAFDSATPACSDGVDNDGDGLSDILDPDCYGPRGRSEESGANLGFAQLSIDEKGLFLYAAQSTGRQVVIVDLQRRKLIDAPRSASVPYPFAENLGVAVARQSVPSSITAHIRRVITRDPRELYRDAHAIVRYDLGAHVVADNGFIYYVDAGSIYCDLYETGRGGVLSTERFYMDPEGFSAYQEHHCLSIPELPLNEAAADVPSCESVVLCQSCTEGADPDSDDDNVAFERCGACQGFEEEGFSDLSSACQLPDRSVSVGVTRRIFNPKFTVRDAVSESAREDGRAQCELPEAFARSAAAFVANNPGVGSATSCGSKVIPQPVALTVPTRGNASPDDFGGEERFSLIETRERRYFFGSVEEDGPEDHVRAIVGLNTEDFRIREEDWTIEYEGILPGTRRSDGLAGEDDPSVFDIGTVNVCLSDVREGDWLIINSEPGTDTGGIPDSCMGFVSPDGADDFLSYRIAEVRDGEVVLETVSAEDGEDARFVQSLPTRSCFPRGISYEIRAADVWVVSGSESGLASGKRRVDGVCVPGNGAPSARANARAETGEVFNGPLFSFYLYPGLVAPERGLAYVVSLDRNFSSASTTVRSATNITLDTDSLRPSFLDYTLSFVHNPAVVEAYDPDAPDAKRPVAVLYETIVTVDPSDNTVYTKLVSQDRSSVVFLR